MNRSRLFPYVHRIVQSAFSRPLGSCLLVAAFTLSTTSTVAQFVGPTPLTFVNGWTDAPFATSHAMVEVENDFVHFRGAISGGTSAIAFTLPSAFRPNANVYLPVDLCNSNNGRLFIQPTGDVSVQAEKAFSDAQCFTSLDGVSFPRTPTTYAGLTLINGWTNAPFATRFAGYRMIGFVVHLKGAIATTGTNTTPFIMPAGTRPATDVYIPVDLCNANKGRLHITPSGVVDVEAEGGTFSNAQCFTSLEGASYLPALGPAQTLTPLNGWTSAPFSTSNPAATNQYGLVYFKGAIATAGTNAQPFTLPLRFRPVTDVYVPVDLCNAAKGRLYIQPSGNVTVQAETSFADAQCFTSLDGVSFVQ
jgi:hypothetical protein